MNSSSSELKYIVAGSTGTGKSRATGALNTYTPLDLVYRRVQAGASTGMSSDQVLSTSTSMKKAPIFGTMALYFLPPPVVRTLTSSSAKSTPFKRSVSANGSSKSESVIVSLKRLDPIPLLISMRGFSVASEASPLAQDNRETACTTSSTSMLMSKIGGNAPMLSSGRPGPVSSHDNPSSALTISIVPSSVSFVYVYFKGSSLTMRV